MTDTTTSEAVDLDVEGIVFGIWDQRANATFIQNAVELIRYCMFTVSGHIFLLFFSVH